MKLFLYIFSFSLLFIFVSCEENFSPKSQFREYYILNCIIGVEDPGNPYAPTHEVKAVIDRTYDEDGFVPTESKSSLVRGVNISLIKKLDQYYFTDTLKTKSGFTLLDYYTPQNSPKFFPFDKIKITAKMPDGNTVTAETVVPQILTLKLDPDFSHGITPKVNQFIWGKGATISWESDYPEHLLFPQLTIPYHIISTNQSYTIDVPLKYIDKGGKIMPLYPSAIKGQSVTFEFAAIDSALNQISSGNLNKNDIEVGNCEFKLMEFDTNLSTYYSSTNGYLDSYSVRLDDNTYTDIRGGFGIFGSYFINRMPYYFDKSYIESFGYKYSRNY